eukprot:scaffold146990_cov22-Tisochrysis_lutea.AAC.1
MHHAFACSGRAHDRWESACKPVHLLRHAGMMRYMKLMHSNDMQAKGSKGHMQNRAKGELNPNRYWATHSQRSAG